MDPYLEGYLWPDVHQRLAAEISRQLTPLIRPRYVARLAVYVVEDLAPEVDLGIFYPDVEVLTTARRSQVSETGGGSSKDLAEFPSLTAPLTLPLMMPVEVRVPAVEIRDTAQNRLVSSIEILSPVNKRDDGLVKYRQKRRRLYEAGVHLVEIDLLRRGERAIQHPSLLHVTYLITLTRAGASQIEAWPVAMQDVLPTAPIPLLPPDPDAPLNLSLCLKNIYAEAAYELSVNYDEPPPPPALSKAEEIWIRALLANSG
jgi:hypothetical protein